MHGPLACGPQGAKGHCMRGAASGCMYAPTAHAVCALTPAQSPIMAPLFTVLPLARLQLWACGARNAGQAPPAAARQGP